MPEIYLNTSLLTHVALMFVNLFLWISVTEGREEMFYLTTNSTHFIYGYMASDIWLRTIQIAREGNPLPPHGLLFPISSNGSFISTDRITHTTAFVAPVVQHWLEIEIALWFHHEGSIRRAIAPWANALNKDLHLAPVKEGRKCFTQQRTQHIGNPLLPLNGLLFPISSKGLYTLSQWKKERDVAPW